MVIRVGKKDSKTKKIIAEQTKFEKRKLRKQKVLQLVTASVNKNMKKNICSFLPFLFSFFFSLHKNGFRINTSVYVNLYAKNEI